MSTVISCDPGPTLPWAVSPPPPEQHLKQTDLIPRSARQDIDDPVDPPQACQHLTSGSSSEFDMPSRRDLNIDFPLDQQSSFSVEVTHDGKVMELVARYENYAGIEDSDVLEVPTGDRTRASSAATIRQYESDADTVRGSHAVHIIDKNTGTEAGIINQSSPEDSCSPRKPIPSHWLGRSSGSPTLATAQRAKDRESRKKGLQDSPIEAKTIRSVRSSMDLGKHHGPESASPSTRCILELSTSGTETDHLGVSER